MGAAGALGYYAVLVGLSFCAVFSERIKDQEHLDKVVAEEAHRLGLDKPVKAKLYSKII